MFAIAFACVASAFAAAETAKTAKQEQDPPQSLRWRVPSKPLLNKANKCGSCGSREWTIRKGTEVCIYCRSHR
jgi:hypothetical protein